jgi:GNAT superfamily N-acetyltransferase
MSEIEQIAWCLDDRMADRIAAFFETNITSSYISHSELQGGRALAPDRWNPDLRATFRQELLVRLKLPHGAAIRVATAFAGNDLMCIAYVTFNKEVSIPHVIVEDIVVDGALRGQGIGQHMLDWIFARAKEEGITRAFLESGNTNHSAHKFFERNGFRQVSIVMMKEFDLPRSI